MQRAVCFQWVCSSSSVHESSHRPRLAAGTDHVVLLTSDLTTTLPPAPHRPVLHTAPIDFAAAASPTQPELLSSLGSDTALHRNWAPPPLAHNWPTLRRCLLCPRLFCCSDLQCRVISGKRRKLNCC